MSERGPSRPRPQLVRAEGEGLGIDRELLVRMHELMVKARVLEERLIQMYKAGRRLLLDWWSRGGGLQRPLGPAHEARPGSGLRLPPRALPAVGHAAGVGRGASRRPPADEEHGDRPVLGGAQLRRPLHQARVEHRADQLPHRGAVRHGARDGDGPEARRRRRHHHRQGRRRGHGRGRFRQLPGVEQPRPGSELPILIIVTNNQLGHLHRRLDAAGRREASPTAARPSACERPDHRRQRRGGQLPGAEGGDGLRARASASRSSWRRMVSPPLRALQRLGRQPRRRRGGLHRHASRSSWRERASSRRAAMAQVRERWTKELADAARRVRDEPHAGAGEHLEATSTRNGRLAPWPTWHRPSGWRCTTARRTSASPTSSARTSGRRWAASSPPRRA